LTKLIPCRVKKKDGTRGKRDQRAESNGQGRQNHQAKKGGAVFQPDSVVNYEGENKISNGEGKMRKVKSLSPKKIRARTKKQTFHKRKDRPKKYIMGKKKGLNKKGGENRKENG